MLEMCGVTGRLEEGGSLGTFVCVPPVEIFGHDLVQRHIHIYIRVVSTRAKYGQRYPYLFEHLKNDRIHCAQRRNNGMIVWWTGGGSPES